jgi:hypothetical protein
LRRLTEHQAVRTKREIPPDVSQSKYSIHSEERILKATKEKKT